jgi:hypothetical protein
MVNSQSGVSIFTSLQRDMSILLLMHLYALYLPPYTFSSPFNFQIVLYLPSLLLLLYSLWPTFLFPSSYFSPHTALADIPPLKYSCTYVHICPKVKNFYSLIKIHKRTTYQLIICGLLHRLNSTCFTWKAITSLVPWLQIFYHIYVYCIHTYIFITEYI